jgi:small subunit ribosomal protein S2
LLGEAKEVLKEAGKNGKKVLFVGTKEEIASIVRKYAVETGMPHMTNRWIGGTLTNFSEIKKRTARLNDLAQQEETGELERKYTKKERVVIGREFDKLTFNFGGIKDLEKVPQLMVIVDPRHNHIAVSEANEMNIPVIGLTSTDANLRVITHPVLMNDSLQASVELVLGELAESLNEGKTAFVPKEEEKKRGR